MKTPKDNSTDESESRPSTMSKKQVTIHNVPINISSNSNTSDENSSNSALALGMESCKQRVRMLEQENRKLMANQGMLVQEANRRVEMHLSEIRMLKEENKSLKSQNKELRDLCGALDEDRQRIKRLSKEWQKFGKYTSELMKQEITSYQLRLQDYEQRHHQLATENDELKRLCLYLDEQRQAILAQVAENQSPKLLDEYYSSDAGCGSSARSSDSEQCNGLCDQKLAREVDDSKKRLSGCDYKFNDEQEKTLRRVEEQMHMSMIGEEENLDTTVSTESQVSHPSRLFSYIQSLESRIHQLEQTYSHIQLHDHFSRSTSRQTTSNRDDSPGYFRSSNASFRDGMQEWRASPGLCTDDSVLVDGSKKIEILSKLKVDEIKKDDADKANKVMEESTTTMTSSGTTYCSSETDSSAATAVFVMSDDLHTSTTHLEVRTLGPIDEEEPETETSLHLPDPESPTLTSNTTPIQHEDSQTPQTPPEKPARRRERNKTRYMSEPLLFGFDRKPSQDQVWVSVKSQSACPEVDDQGPDSKRISDSSNEHADNEEDSLDVSELPPKMRLIGESGRFSLCSSNLSLDRCSHSSRQSNGSIKTVETNRSLPDEVIFRKKAPPPYHHNHLRVHPELSPIHPVNSRHQLQRRHTSSLADAVRVLRVHEKASDDGMQEMDEQRTAIVHQLCHAAWNSLDRKARVGVTQEKEISKNFDVTAHITTV